MVLCLSPCVQGADKLAEGQLLVAGEELRGSPFAETVIFLVRYDRDGAMGLVVNRRTGVPISRALRALKEAQGHTDPVFSGGPVEEDAILALVRSETRPEGARHVSGDAYVLSSKALLQKLLGAKAEPAVFRVYFGYAGWGRGQLESELEAGAWHVLQANTDTVFDPDPDTLWSRLNRKTTQQLASASIAHGFQEQARRGRGPSGDVQLRILAAGQ
jgi:putative transcriptional regulator